MLKRLIFSSLFGALAAFGLMIFAASAGTAAGQTNPEAVQDTPVPVLNFDRDLRQWSIAAGNIYLSDTCSDGSAETTAYIKRRAINGQTILDLESINSKPQCRTFRHAATDASGIYYYNRNLGRIEAIYTNTPFDPPKVVANIGDWDEIGLGGDSISALRLDSKYVYWIEMIFNGGEPEDPPDDYKIKRVSKSGGTPVTLYSFSKSGLSFEGLGVTGRHVWWTDNNGLNRIFSCTVQQCTIGPRVKTIEFPVSTSAMDGYIEISGSNVFWWNRRDTNELIRRTSCSLIGNNCSTSSFQSPGNEVTVIGAAANSDALFWTEQVPLIGSRLRRKAFSGGSAETLVDKVSFAAPYIDVEGVYFQTGSRTISRLPFDAQALTREISVNAWEVTQGIQRPLNDVPRVAGKTTFVRLYPTLDDGDNVIAAWAELHGTRNGQALPGSPIYPLNGAIPIYSFSSLASRGSVDGGWLFKLPDSWTRTGDGSIPQEDTTISLRGVIDPYGVYADTDDPGNNEISDDFLFTAKAPTCIAMRSVATKSSYESATGINVGQLIELTDSLLPGPGLITFRKDDALRKPKKCWKGIFYGSYCSTTYELDDDDSDLLARMDSLNYWDDNNAICDDNNARTLYTGILHKDVDWQWGGLAGLGRDSYLAKVPAYGEIIDRLNGRAMTTIHEIGHNYSRRHIQCPLPPTDPDDEDNSPGNPDPNYPYPTNRLDAGLMLMDPNLHFGFDPLLREPVRPDDNADYLSYCDPSWYSDYTWKAIFNNTSAPNDSFATNAVVAGELVRITGLIDVENNYGRLDYAWMLPANEASDGMKERWAADLAPARNRQAAGADYHVQLIGAGGQVLADKVVELTTIEDGDENGPVPFDLTLTAPAGVVTRLQLMDGDTILALRSPGPARPVVAINQPVGGANIDGDITIGWTAGDADGDQLLYTIQYSPDGGDRWHPLRVAYGGTLAASETITLSLSSEAGSNGANALVRILASDDYNTGVATSQPFTVAKRAPFVAITSPQLNQTYAAEELILLQGNGGDAEDGLIEDDKFAWSTGQTGQTAERSGLAPGPHTIKLTATDSDGQEATSSISFAVAPLAVPKATATSILDGRCDDESYADAPQLLLTPYAGGVRPSARIMHDSTKVWLCLSGLQDAGGYAGLLIDADNSGDAAVQSSDIGYFVRQDGTSFASKGNGSGLVKSSNTNFSARIVDNGEVWSAELQISRSAFGSFQKRLALTIGHFEQTGNRKSTWPRSAVSTSPQSWGQTNLGLAALTAVTPDTAVLGTGDIALTVSGSNFDGDNIVLWDGTALATTLVDASTLTAVVPANLAPKAGTYGVAAGVEGQADLKTAATPFTVNNPRPAINSLSPDTTVTGSGGKTVTIDGTGFIDGATAVWDGEKRATTFVSPTRLRISLTAAELSGARPIQVVVLNPGPAVGPSNAAVFLITSGLEHHFLPVINR